MSKANPTRRQAPARVATPEERAEEDRHCEEARAAKLDELAEEALRERAPSGFILEPKSKLALEAEAYQASRNELVNFVTIIERSWAPLGAVEIVAAFQELARWVSRGDEEVDQLRIQYVLLERRLAVLEQNVLRRDHFDARIDELEQAVKP